MISELISFILPTTTSFPFGSVIQGPEVWLGTLDRVLGNFLISLGSGPTFENLTVWGEEWWMMFFCGRSLYLIFRWLNCCGVEQKYLRHLYITRYDRYLALSWLNVRLRLYLHLFARFCKVLRRLQRTSAMRCDEVLLWGFRCSPSVVEAVGEIVSASSKSLRACVWKNDGYMMVIYSVKYCVI